MDRKGWIILIFCSIALMLNYMFLKENQEKIIEGGKDTTEDPAQQSTPDGEKLDTDATADPNLSGGTTTAAGSPLTAKKDDPYEIFAITDDEKVTKFTFSNIGGGIKTAEMLLENKLFVNGNVTLNEQGDSVIGALATSYKDIETTYYDRIDQSNNSVKYQGQLEDGVTVTKAWTLEEGTADKAPRFKLVISFKTKEGKTLNLNKYSITSGTAAPLFKKEQVNLAGWFYYEDGDYQQEDHGNFSGGMFSDEKPVDNITTENLEYFGVNSQFFATAIFPQSDAKSDTLWASGEETTIGDEEGAGKRWIFQVGLELPETTVNSDETKSISYEVFVGAKQNRQMSALSENSDDIMNFSMFSAFGWISDKMNKALNGIHNWFPESSPWSWGLAIVLLTIFIRIIIWPLHNKSTRTMKRMSKLQPIMKELKEKHKENPQKLNQETMKLYREYGVNPMGGCLPMLVQIPIFFGVFNMINAAVELRGQPFMWVQDLSQPDHLTDVFGLPLNLLPILMAVTMVIQMRMTPQTGDKLQRRIFMLMPLMFFVFCYNYASALALYWTTQNIVSIGQTWLTQRMPEPELAKKVARGAKKLHVDNEKPRKKGFMEKMAEKLEEAQVQRDAKAGKAPPAEKKTPGQPAAKKPKKRNPKTGG
ncbi:MAG: YidC/Oxa1 family membrane protein insertase [Cryomorphaceae bacterium]|jgi:YidC/Oxa1 family membrane protein insertase